MKIVEVPKYFDPTENPYSVVGKTCQCPYCGTTFIVESVEDIREVTYKGDSNIYCPNCQKKSWHYYGTDDKVHSGKLLD